MQKLNQKSSLLEKASRTAEIESLHHLSLERQVFLTFFCAGDLFEDLDEVKKDPWYRGQIRNISEKYSRIAAMI